MTFGTCKLGYLAIETSKPEKWRAFNAKVLGLPACGNGDGSLGLQIDGARHRLIIVPGERDDVRGRDVAVAVLDPVEIFDEEIAPPWGVAEQGCDFICRSAFNNAALEFTAHSLPRGFTACQPYRLLQQQARYACMRT